ASARRPAGSRAATSARSSSTVFATATAGARCGTGAGRATLTSCSTTAFTAVLLSSGAQHGEHGHTRKIGQIRAQPHAAIGDLDDERETRAEQKAQHRAKREIELHERERRHERRYRGIKHGNVRVVDLALQA